MKILVAMSGGVDSSVAALLLKKAGHEVVGMTLRVHDDPERKARLKSCCAPRDILDAREVAQALDIPYYAIDMRREFHQHVIEPFAQDYLNGRTPNPCVRCNSELKFGLLFQRAKSLGLDQVATGHYARCIEDTGKLRLLRGVDRDKDQSYFLFGLSTAQLAHTILPLGNLTKNEVRNLAREAGFTTADKVESQEICFVPDGDYAKVVEETFSDRESASRKGEILDDAGTKMGQHEGVHHFTIGQRKGLGLSHPRPLYVLGINAKTQQVTVGSEALLYRQKLRVEQVNWLGDELQLGHSFRCDVSIRYRHAASQAQVTILSPEQFEVCFDSPQRAISPGQAAVFYQKDVVLGGGWIV